MTPAPEQIRRQAVPVPAMVPRPIDQMVRDLVSLARTQNRIAIRYRIEADAYAATGNLRLYRQCLLDARDYCRRAKANLQLARNWTP